MILQYTDRARADIDTAIAWYEMQQPGLGLQFLDCIEEAVTNIIDRPESFPLRHLNFQGCVIARFPFTLYFTKEQSNIIVHAVFDNRQNPAKKPL